MISLIPVTEINVMETNWSSGQSMDEIVHALFICSIPIDFEVITYLVVN